MEKLKKVCMLEASSLLARKLRFLKPVTLIIMLSAAGIFAWSLLSDINDQRQNEYVQGAMLAFVWAMITHLFLVTFQQNPTNKPKSGLLKKGIYFIKKLYFRLIVVVFIIMTGAVMVITVRLLRLMITN